ncbi:histidine biosynthesis bifunctional protein HisB [Adhaeribacter aerolatus]|uniref:Histidine biosynthesis bifunctional protein HisB n=1 Tax=Adhaeribacter aerolatus TaxID=670289 RepID=A0A512AVA1_9BACT|nr:bifunctional histidinol-phosphatase/imidazoleglycerol-phosphate dehydratase HisB [Adhaeribacter aerolatus]GEO03635.1 histidine biosynthesis bifunctional protein HisB [Adhaeribacter aerolatus]
MISKKKVLFIDRDGTILLEPPTDFQVDSFEKFSFYPGVIRNLYKIQTELDYDFVMVTNQDGLGTTSYPEETFWPYQNKMLEILEGEGITFSNIHIDRSFEHENLPSRKPGIGMLNEYFAETYDLANSYVIGDRLTDIQLAENLGAKSILLATAPNERATITTTNWDEIYKFLRLPDRTASVVRNTNETKIQVSLNLDGKGHMQIHTGLGFFDHMLEQLSKHSGADMAIQVQGDLHIDEHHTIEDTAIALGEAFSQALGNKMGISRYGYLLPMDDVLAQVAIDFSGRPWLVWEAEFKREKVGDMPTEMFYHFFKSFSDAAKCNLNVKAEGANEHHKIEAIFKAVAKSIKMAVARDVTNMALPSTKGVL